MFTRRQFLENSILATTAALASPVAAASTAEPKKTSANERLSVAVIGVGIRGPVHVRSFHSRSDCDVVAICDADISRAERQAKGLGHRGAHHCRNSNARAVADTAEIFDCP